MKGIYLVMLSLPCFWLGCGTEEPGRSILHESPMPAMVGIIEAGETLCAATYDPPATVLTSLSCLSEAGESEGFFTIDSRRLALVSIVGLDRDSDLIAFKIEEAGLARRGFSLPKINWPDLPKVPDGGLSERLKDLVNNLDPASWIADLTQAASRKIAAEVAPLAIEGGWTRTSCMATGAGAILLPAAVYITPLCASSGVMTAGMGIPACVAAVSTSIVAATCATLCETKNLSDCR